MLKKNFTQGGFAVVYILVALVVLGAVAGGAYYFGKSSIKQASSVVPNQMVTNTTPTITSVPKNSDETVNWKTYTDTLYGFSLKYPKDWILEAPSENDVVDKNDESPISSIDPSKKVHTVTLRTVTGDQYFSIIDINPEFGPSMLNPVESKLQPEPFVIGGRKTKVYYFVNNIGNKVYSYSDFGLPKLPKFGISVNYPQKDAEIVSKILSTFKFTQ